MVYTTNPDNSYFGYHKADKNWTGLSWLNERETHINNSYIYINSVEHEICINYNQVWSQLFKE